MKKYLGLTIILFVIFSCSNQEPEEKLKNINGYWEIESVELSKDSVRFYKFNENIDFFNLENKKGVRKKVKPQLNGTYAVTENAENIEAKIEDGELFLYYTTPYDSWKEKVISAKENKLSLEASSGIIYHYKKYIPLIDFDNETK